MIRETFAVIHTLLIFGLLLAALATLAGGIASMFTTVRWNSRKHPAFPAPILHLGYEQLGRPWIIYHCDAPAGGPNLAETFHYGAGVWINTGKYNCGIRYYDVRCPLWMPVVLSGAYPVMWLLSRGPVRRHRRRRMGQCGECAYDLTGNTLGVCPECGEGVDR